MLPSGKERHAWRRLIVKGRRRPGTAHGEIQRFEAAERNRTPDSPPGKPEESLMVQIVNSVKELKALRIESDKMRGEVTDNTRTNKNLIRLTWLIVGLLITTIGRMIAYG